MFYYTEAVILIPKISLQRKFNVKKKRSPQSWLAVIPKLPCQYNDETSTSKNKSCYLLIPIWKVDENKKDNITEAYIMPYNHTVLYTLYR